MNKVITSLSFPYPCMYPCNFRDWYQMVSINWIWRNWDKIYFVRNTLYQEISYNKSRYLRYFDRKDIRDIEIWSYNAKFWVYASIIVRKNLSGKRIDKDFGQMKILGKIIGIWIYNYWKSRGSLYIAITDIMVYNFIWGDYYRYSKTALKSSGWFKDASKK